MTSRPSGAFPFAFDSYFAIESGKGVRSISSAAEQGARIGTSGISEVNVRAHCPVISPHPHVVQCLPSHSRSLDAAAKHVDQ
jgi:hypothetical protein